MNRHSFWCDVSKNNPCDCGFTWIEQARHILLEIYQCGHSYVNEYTDDWVCFYCNETDELAYNKKENIEHSQYCPYNKLHKFLEQHNELPQ